MSLPPHRPLDRAATDPALQPILARLAEGALRLATIDSRARAELARRTALATVAVADRGEPSNNESSPKICPENNEANVVRSLPSPVWMSMAPSMIRNRLSPS